MRCRCSLFPALGVLVFLAFQALPVAWADVTLSVADSQSAPESEISIPLMLESPEAVGGMSFELHYDPQVLQLKSVDRGTLLSGKNVLLETNPNDPGRLRVAFVGLDAIQGKGELALATFGVVGASGLGTDLHLEAVEAMEAESMRELRTTASDGKLSVSGMTFPWWIWIIVGAVLILILMMLFSKSAKSKPTSEPAKQQGAVTSQGTVTKPGKFCGQCGSPLKPEQQFCGSCGAKIVQA